MTDFHSAEILDVRAAVRSIREVDVLVSPEEENQAHERGLLLMREWKQRNRHLRRD